MLSLSQSAPRILNGAHGLVVYRLVKSSGQIGHAPRVYSIVCTILC